ncbi:MAG: hypothetical protein RI925_11 [Pseudomonadota bacterium]|jgi:DNA-binding MarR family transcriptional regulator
MPTLDSSRWDVTLDVDVVPLFLQLQWAQARSLAGMRPSLEKYALSEAEFDLLATLRNAEVPHTLTPSQLLARMVLTSGGLSKVMAQLETRGLIRRLQSAQDLRIKPVQLSAAGRALIETAMVETVAATRAWLRATLRPEALGQLTTLLAKLAESGADEKKSA